MAVRGILLVALVTHVVLVVQLYTRSLAARPVAYRVKKNIATSYAAATMKYSGPALLLYILFHLAHFTSPGLSLGGHQFSPIDVYGNFVASFQLPWVTLLYVTANLLLGMHLYHGAYSLLQSLGLESSALQRTRPPRRSRLRLPRHGWQRRHAAQRALRHHSLMLRTKNSWN